LTVAPWHPKLTDFDNRAWDEFKGPVTALVQKAFPDAEYIAEDGWYYLGLPVRNGNFWLEVNYLWDKIYLEIPDDAEPSSDAEKKALYEVRGKHFNSGQQAITTVCCGSARKPYGLVLSKTACIYLICESSTPSIRRKSRIGSSPASLKA
jgi:hypothetical protein